MRLTIALVLFFFTHSLLAQNNAEIKGRVFDSSKAPLEKATVSIVSENDSLVLSYSLTDSKGNFDFIKIPTQKPLLLYVSHVNSSLFSKKLTLKDGQKLNMDSIIMGGITLEEVVITAVPPIRLNGDTLEYKADYFKTRPNATVEELLQLLPGLQVNADGTIYYQGKQVSGVRVNNKDFFAQDLKIATKNLDAALIDVVQVIKDKGESKREIIDDSELPIVLNLKMKKEFLKANFGKLYGGAATRDRYESGALINTFRDTLQVSFIGFANNIGRQGFDYSELSEYGGLSRAENMRFTSYGSGGLINQMSAGVNVNYDIKKKLKTNLMYNFEKITFFIDSKNESQFFYDQVQEQSSGENRFENDRMRHELRGLARYHIDTTAMVSYEATVSKGISENTNNFVNARLRGADNPVERIVGDALNSSDNFSYNHYVKAEKKFRNKWLLSLNHRFSISDDQSDNNNNMLSNFYLLNDSVADFTTRLLNNSKNQNLAMGLNLQIPVLKKLNMDLYASQDYSKNQRTEDIHTRLNSDIFEDRSNIANNVGLDVHTKTIGMKWNFHKIKDLPISFGLNYSSKENVFDYFDRLDNRTEERFYWLPNVSVSYKNLNFSYNKNINTPSIHNLIVVNSDLFPNRMTLASPYFENTIGQDFSLRYNKYFTKPKINIYFYSSYSTKDNSVASDQYYDLKTGYATTQYYQASDVDNYMANLSFTKTFLQNNTWRVNFQHSSYIGSSEGYNRVNEEESLANRMYANFSNTVSLAYKNKITLTPTFNFGFNNTRFENESVNFRNIKNNNRTLGATLLLSDIKKFRLESSYNIRNQVAGIDNKRENLHLVNASIYYPVLGKGELKLSVYDLLNQNVNNYLSVNENRTSYSSNTTLRQYFMLGMVYKFLKTESKK